MLSAPAAGRGRFAAAPVEVFKTSSGCHIVYQLSAGRLAPVAVQGGGQSGRVEACQLYGAESAAYAQHTVLIWDRRNTGDSDVDYTGIQGGAGENQAQAEELAELLQSTGLAGWILVGYSSGARLFGMLMIRAPGLVRAAVLANLTGGPDAASWLGRSYYGCHAQTARRGGMRAVICSPYYQARLRHNSRSEDNLARMTPEQFCEAMCGSCGLYTETQSEPALGMPAKQLAEIRVPVLVLNSYGDANDGMHTPEVAVAVAAAIPGGKALVSQNLGELQREVASFIDMVTQAGVG